MQTLTPQLRNLLTQLSQQLQAEPNNNHTSEQNTTIANWLQKFEQSKRPSVCATTWKTDYFRPFSQLPTDVVLSPEVLLNAIALTAPNTRQRRRFCLAFRQLAEFAGIELNVHHLIGSYGPTKVQPRDLPTDEYIAGCFK